MQTEIDIFLESFFQEIKDVSEFHLNYLRKNSFVFPDVDYIQLKRFMDTATNNLYNLEPHLLSGLLGKLYQDIKSLYEYYQKFKSQVKIPQIIFHKQYLSRINLYKELSTKLQVATENMEQFRSTMESTENELKMYKEAPKDTELLNKYKNLKKRNVDAIYYFSEYKDEFIDIKSKLVEFEKNEELEFFPKFKDLKDKYLSSLENILNSKMFYFNKLLWYEAQKSETITRFFEESNIDGDYSTKTFIKYYLKNIDISKANNSEWLTYLNKILKVLD
jgi:hypothetical protein